MQKILVIEDEEDYREIIAVTLNQKGYEVIKANNGLDGLAAVKMHHPDLILCDINMPKMNGLSLLGIVKEEQEFAGIPFIFLTGNVATADVRKGMQQGADDYLTKPFTSEELIAAVETRLTNKTKIQKFYESQFDEIKENIISHLPHEFRTPLNGILGCSQILLDESGMPENEVKEMALFINNAGKRLHHLLENMVLFGQMQLWMHDKNKIHDMQLESTTVREVMNAVGENQMMKHERPNAVHISLNDTIVQMSSLYLTKVVDEIIDNALKFSKSGTFVQISGEEKGSQLHISIQDNGRGMTEEQIKRISGFNQFERGYYEQQGAGLGLIIAKMLVDLHGGSFLIESVEKKGTTVLLSLPKSQKG